MRSLQWRMIAALGIIILICWSISISILIDKLPNGPENVWDGRLKAISDPLIRLVPESWSAGRAGGKPGDDGLEGTLLAIVLNTLQLAIAGALMVWAVRASLRPLARTVDTLKGRDAFDSSPLSTADVPSEVRPLIVSFNSLLEKVETAMLAERNFISDAAHELRTPLSALHAHAEVARHSITVEQKDAALDKLLQVSYRSIRLAEQLLDLARLEGGHHSVVQDHTDLSGLAAHVISEFKMEAELRGISLILSGRPCWIICDIDEIGVLIRNLVDNAIRYGRENGVVEVHCGFTERDSRKFVVLEVRDDGPGVPKEERGAIFERFYRIQGTQARGSGIGLSLVAGIAKLHDAAIEIDEGRGGRGLCVRLLFPSRV